MEKPTTHSTPTDPAAWSRLAAATALALTPDRFLAGRHDLWPQNHRGRAHFRGAHERPGWGLHTHHTPELCLSLTGRVTMTLADRFYDFSPPRLALIEAQTLHSESRARADQPYAILWLGPTTNSLLCHLSRYRPGRGWDCPWRYVHRDPAPARLLAQLTAQGSLPPQRFAIFLAELAAQLSELHRRVTLAAAAHEDPSSTTHDTITHVRTYLDQHLDQPLTLQNLAALVNLSPNHLNTLFRQRVGCGIRQYLIARRMDRALTLCRKQHVLIKQVAAQVGYDDPLYFSKAFRQYHGTWPTQLPR